MTTEFKENNTMIKDGRSGHTFAIFLLIVFAVFWVWLVATGVEQREIREKELREKEWARREEKIRMEYRIKELEERLYIQTNDAAKAM